MRIGIDARFLTHPQAGGFKTYSENLISALAAVDVENEYILYLDRSPDQQARLPERRNFSIRVVPGLLPVFGMPWREQVRLAGQAARDRLDLLHAPSLTAPLRLECPLVVTIHDMIWFSPGKYATAGPGSIQRQLMEWYYRYVPQFAARRAKAILTVSQAAKDSIVKCLGLASDRILVTHEAASSLYRHVDDVQQVEAVRRKYELNFEFVLAIGSADPRKNMATLVHAYALLPIDVREKYRLVIVWTHSLLAAELYKQVNSLGIASQLRFLKCVTNADLMLLYNAASLFVFPSRYEGFGLPLLEAMACGTPVVAANNSSIPEIVGDAALLVDAENSKEMAATMAHILTDVTAQTILSEKGIKRAAGFSWENCARQTVVGYRQARLGG